MAESTMIDPEVVFAEVAPQRRMTPVAFGEQLKRTIFKGMTVDEMIQASSDIARYGLDPFSNQILFLKLHGKMQTCLTVDGWNAVAQRQGVVGVSTSYETLEDGDISCKATVRKRGENGDEEYSRTEFLSECRRSSKQWKDMPRRMLGHRAITSTYRVACGTLSIASAEELQESGFQRPSESHGTELLIEGVKND